MSHSFVTINLEGPADDLGGRKTIEGLLDQMMEQLLLCVTDPSVSESYHDDGTVSLEFAMEVEAAAPDEAVVAAMSALRSSLHGLGAATPGWEDLIRQMRSDVRAITQDDDLVDA